MLNRGRILMSLFILSGVLIGSIVSSILFKKTGTIIDPERRLMAPSFEHLLGTDYFGRDILARTLIAAKISLFIGSIVAIVSTIIGTFTGLICGYYRRADFILMRIVDGFLAFPSLLLALALVAALGGNILNIMIALTLTFSPFMARIVRSSVLEVRNLAYIEAAQVNGISDWIIMIRYILPNVLTPIIVQGTFIFAKAILAEAALSFLGVGIDPTTATWGNMLEESQIYIQVAPWTSIFPGLAILLTVFALNILGDCIRDILNPRSTMQGQRKKFDELHENIGAA